MKRTPCTWFCHQERDVAWVKGRVSRAKQAAAWLLDTHDGQMRRKGPAQLKLDQHNARAERNFAADLLRAARNHQRSAKQ